jgi:hypothetical protein
MLFLVSPEPAFPVALFETIPSVASIGRILIPLIWVVIGLELLWKSILELGGRVRLRKPQPMLSDFS